MNEHVKKITNGFIMTGIEVQDIGQNPCQNGELLATSVTQPAVYSGCHLGKMLTDQQL